MVRPPTVVLYGADPIDCIIGGIRLKQTSLLSGSSTWERGKRGEVGGFSYASKRRLREAIWSVTPAVLARKDRQKKAWISPASFITLTYPATFEPDTAICKVHLQTWWKRIVRAWPDSWGFWVIEQQSRGAWHFHLLVRWPGETSRRAWLERMAWVSRTWADVVAEGGRADDDHLKAGTRVDRVVTVDKLTEYVAKPGTKIVTRKSDGLARELTKHAQKETAGQGRCGGASSPGRTTRNRRRLLSRTCRRRHGSGWPAKLTWSGNRSPSARVLTSSITPAWASGALAEEALHRAGLTQADLFTELISMDGEELTLADFGDAAEA